MLCAVALAGCQGHAAASQSVDSVVSPSATSTAAMPAAGSATVPSGAGADSELNAVDGQLADLDSAMAQATQSPSDGG